jgi:hypothetical protein
MRIYNTYEDYNILKGSRFWVLKLYERKWDKVFGYDDTDYYDTIIIDGEKYGICIEEMCMSILMAHMTLDCWKMLGEIIFLSKLKGGVQCYWSGNKIFTSKEEALASINYDKFINVDKLTLDNSVRPDPLYYELKHYFEQNIPAGA